MAGITLMLTLQEDKRLLLIFLVGGGKENKSGEGLPLILGWIVRAVAWRVIGEESSHILMCCSSRPFLFTGFPVASKMKSCRA